MICLEFVGCTFTVNHIGCNLLSIFIITVKQKYGDGVEESEDSSSDDDEDAEVTLFLQAAGMGSIFVVAPTRDLWVGQ